MSRQRSAERTEFLSDIIITAVEGGIGHWSVCSQYQVAEEGELHGIVGKVEVADPSTRATIWESEEYNDAPDDLHITLDLIAHGIQKVKNPLFSINSRLAAMIRQADSENDAGMIDAEAADVIVQAGLFGKIVYGG